MPQTYEWSKLSHLQVGRYAEYFVKMQFVLLGYEVYSSEVDDRGIDFVLRREPGRYWDVQVKSIRKTGYVFMRKDKFQIRSNLLVAGVVFNDGLEPDLFLIPAASWLTPDGVLVDHEYGEGLRSKPEYGINLSRKGIATLAKYRLGTTVDNILTDEGAQPAIIPAPVSSANEGVAVP